MTEPSYLTSELIRDTALYDSIPFYLHEGETTEGIRKKFNGDLVKAIQFLRERDYATIEVVKPKPVIPPRPEKKPEVTTPAPKAIKKKPSKDDGQKGLF